MTLFFVLLSWLTLENCKLQSNIKFPVSLYLQLIYGTQTVLISKLTSNSEPCDTRAFIRDYYYPFEIQYFQIIFKFNDIKNLK